MGAAVILLAGLPAVGQTCRPAEVRVSVKDSQDSPIFDAQVSVGIGESRTTPASGMVEFANVACGKATLHVSKAGFEPGETAIEVGAQSVVDVSMTLNPQIVRSSVEVTAAPSPVEQSSSQNYEIRPAEVKALPSNPATAADALPLVPGVVRSPNGELIIDGSGEQRSSLVVNQNDVTDPATGKFGNTVPIDGIESVNVLTTPFLAQYGRFTQSVVVVETKRGGDRWHADLSDPFPDFRVRSNRMLGIRNETPRGALGGPVIANRLYFITSLHYFLDKAQERTLGFPHNVSKVERFNSFTQLDYILSPRQVVNFTWHFSPEHINFVAPDYFKPQPSTPAYAQRNYIATLADHLGIFGGTLDSSVTMQRFHTFVNAQGDGEMIVSPQGNSGNYFGVQTRDAWRKEWLEVWSPAPWRLLGVHQWKLGTSTAVAYNRGFFRFHPIQIRGPQRQLLQLVDFTNPGPYKRTDLEVTAYAQDHWMLTPRLSIDYGVRLEHQRLASSFRIAPRVGLAWDLTSDGKTVFRAGYGEFYDHIPLDVYAFSRYPIRTITDYAPDGSILEPSVMYANVIGDVAGPRSFLVNGSRVAGAFSPRGGTLNFQLERSLAPYLRLRAVYTDNRSVGLVVLEPGRLGSTDEIVLNGDGSSRCRQAEFTAKIPWRDSQNVMLSYVHSRAEGSLNTFDSFLGNYALPLFHQGVYTNLPGDVPNRLLVWGRMNLPFGKLSIMPVVEWRSGFPYAVYDRFQNYVGHPYSDATRFDNFFSADARLMREFQVGPKHVVRLSVTGSNLTNRFNPLAVHNNIADPRFGTFFGNNKRRYRFDFEVVR
jgi:hypothetical protein